MDFDQAFDKLLGHEGGFVDHPADPGGATRWGITERVARVAGYRGDMRELPVALAKRIAKTEYWDAVRADDMPPGIRYALFDATYNSGPRQATLWLQRALEVADDGMIGPKTLMVAHATDPRALLPRMLAQRLRFMTGLANWPAFGKGWARRVADLMETTA